MYCTLQSIGSTMIYSSAFSTAIDWMMSIFGTSNFCGASSLMFVKDGVTSSTNAHFTWVCTLNAPMVPL
jgi:hypothetical protein